MGNLHGQTLGQLAGIEDAEPTDDVVETVEEVEVDGGIDEEGGPTLAEFEAINRDELPDELKGQYDLMRKGFDDKMRKLSEDPEIAEARKDSEMLKKILQDPKMRAALVAVEGGEAPEAASPFSLNPYPDEDVSTLFEDEETPKAVLALVMSELDKKLMPMLQKYAGALESMYSEQQTQKSLSAKEKFVEKYPAIADSWTQVEQLSASKGLTIEQAVFAIGGESLLSTAPSPQVETKPEKKVGLSLTKPTMRVKPKGSGSGLSIVELAKQRSKELGLFQ